MGRPACRCGRAQSCGKTRRWRDRGRADVAGDLRGAGGRRWAWSRPASRTRRSSRSTRTRARRCGSTGGGVEDRRGGHAQRRRPRLHRWTCWPAACRARRSPSPASSSAPTTSVTCSRRRCAWSGRSGPRAVLLENVRGLATRRFDGYRHQVLARLRALGYQTWWRSGPRERASGCPSCGRGSCWSPSARGRLAFRWPARPPAADRGRRAARPDGRGRLAGRGAWARRASGIAPTHRRRAARSTAAPTWAPPGRARPGASSAWTGSAWPTTPPGPALPADQPPQADVPWSRDSGLPADWRFSGRKTAAYRQVGNAFPPPVARALGTAIALALSKAIEAPAVTDVDHHASLAVD